MATRRRGRPRRTEAERATRRASLIDATLGAVRAHGADVSIDRIAAAAGVGKPVIYKEFGDKRGLADAVAVQLARDLEAEVLGGVGVLADGEAIDLRAVVASIVTALVDLIDADPDVYEFVVRSIRSSDRGFLDNALVRILHERYSLLATLVLPGMPATEAAVLIDALFGFVFAAVESWQTRREPDKDTLAATLSDVIYRGITTVADRRGPPT